MNDGLLVPQLGFGTSGLGDDATKVVGDALRLGYRHFDTAQMYGTEGNIGEAIALYPVERRELYVTTKVDNIYHSRDEVLRSVDGSLRSLGLDYVDLLLIHWPLPRIRDYVDVWRALIEARADGKVRSIGVSNFRGEHLERVTNETGIVPAVNQIEVHPFLGQEELRSENARRGIITAAWSPLGNGAVLSDPLILEIASGLGRTPAQVALRWHLQHGHIAIPKSSAPGRMRENLDLFDFELNEADMQRITAVNRNVRTGANPADFE
jgi:2,5-diketo-D-gluconate reductase A